MRASLKKFMSDESGSVAIEYACILTLITIGIVGSLASMGNSVSTYLENALAGLTR